MQVTPVKTSIFLQGEDLGAFIEEHVPTLKEGSILAVASKIVALSESRVVEAVEDKEALIRRESEWVKHVFGTWWLTVRDGTVVVNAGIDESNVDPVKSLRDHGASEKMILLPEDSFASAERLYASVLQNTSIRNFGIIITDSRIMPLRAGVVGVALGYAGFKGIRDYRGTPDLFGRPMEVTQTDVADSLATAATLVMGEGAECQPLVIIEDALVVWTDKTDREELKIPRDQDMFKHLFE
ncbi:MAG TPA: coenzyme F420-0:L-glutamate ligase [Candidatus Paceibacterota bacterium]